jgi:hypothetical protein
MGWTEVVAFVLGVVGIQTGIHFELYTAEHVLQLALALWNGQVPQYVMVMED